jgi:transposase InsO family protein
MALSRRHHRPPLAPHRPGLSFHSDRCSQYGSRANPYHKAWTESFGTLKNEMPQGGSFAIEADARIEIFDFIESYNHHRKHFSLRYQTPANLKSQTNTKINPNLVQKSVAPQN